MILGGLGVSAGENIEYTFQIHIGLSPFTIKYGQLTVIIQQNIGYKKEMPHSSFAARYTSRSGTPCCSARRRQSSYSGARFVVPSGSSATLTWTGP